MALFHDEVQTHLYLDLDHPRLRGDSLGLKWWQQSTSDFVLYIAMSLGMGAIAGAVVLWTDNTWWAAGTHGGFHVLLTLLSMLFPIALDSSTWVVFGSTQVLAAIIITSAWWKRERK